MAVSVRVIFRAGGQHGLYEKVVVAARDVFARRELKLPLEHISLSLRQAASQIVVAQLVGRQRRQDDDECDGHHDHQKHDRPVGDALPLSLAVDDESVDFRFDGRDELTVLKRLYGRQLVAPLENAGEQKFCRSRSVKVYQLPRSARRQLPHPARVVQNLVGQPELAENRGEVGSAVDFFQTRFAVSVARTFNKRFESAVDASVHQPFVLPRRDVSFDVCDPEVAGSDVINGKQLRRS